MNGPRGILNRLADADGIYQREAGGRFLMRSIKYICVFVLAAFLLDVVFHLSADWRLRLGILWIAGIFLLAVAAGYFAFFRRNRLEHIARFLESRDPDLGSRLINLLQLRAQVADDSLAPLTRDLADRAVEGYAEELGGVRFERLAWTGDLGVQAKRAAGAVLVLAAVLAIFFRVSAIEIARFADPFGDHPPYAFTRLEVVEPGPAGTNVVYGRGVVVKVKVSGHLPKEVFLTAYPPEHPDRAFTLSMFGQAKTGFHQMVDDIRTELTVHAHTKDGLSRSQQRHIMVELTPQLEKAFVRITPPAYTEQKATESAYAFKNVQALTGSEVQFRLQSNRPLREGRLEINRGNQPPQQVRLDRRGENEVGGAFTVEESGRLKFALVDVSGLTSQESMEGSLTVTYDLPPEVRISEPERDTMVAMDFEPQVRIEFRDDYGVRVLRVHRGVNGAFAPPKVVHQEAIVRSGVEVETFRFEELGVGPGDVISIFAEAVDNAPEPHIARSQTVRLFVISVEDYNNFLRRQMDLADIEGKYRKLMDDLQELIEVQKHLGEAAEKLGDELAATESGDQKREELTRSWDALVARQNELNQKLNQHADRMDHFVRDNPLYDVERDLQDHLNRQAASIRASARQNAASVRDLAMRSVAPDGTRPLPAGIPSEFKEASDAQVANLEPQRRDTEQQITQTLQDMSLMQELQKDFNLFEALYRQQQEISAQAQAYNRSGPMDREDQLALKELAAAEKQVADLLGALERKLLEDANAADKLFPKAAQSGRDLAEQIREHRLEPLARQAVGRMLAGRGDQSFRLAERLRGEMEKLFSECRGGNCPASNELDSYLRLQRMLNPGNNFAQMALSQKYGFGRGLGTGMGWGTGKTGTSGYAIAGAPNLDILGHEAAVGGGNSTPGESDRQGRGAALQAGIGSQMATENPEVMKGLNPVNRLSGAVASETILEDYEEVVDHYFKVITTKQEKP